MFRPNASVKVIGGRFQYELAGKIGVIDKIMDNGAMVCSFGSGSFILSEGNCRLIDSAVNKDEEAVIVHKNENDALADLAMFGASLYE